ncbi:MAG TPA: hypothetical protein VGX48_09875 [Pyrinomonadaceae bacterium]|nr:hypothetical protein [Pyrinomonadaceae bacterium]
MKVAGSRRNQRRRGSLGRAALLAAPAVFWSYVFAALAGGGGVASALAPGAERVACALVGALAAVVVGLGAARGAKL